MNIHCDTTLGLLFLFCFVFSFLDLLTLCVSILFACVYVNHACLSSVEVIRFPGTRVGELDFKFNTLNSYVIT